MNDHHVELIGFTDAIVSRQKVMGLMSEIISWKLRLFVPINTDGPAMLGQLMQRHPLVGLIDRAAVV